MIGNVIGVRYELTQLLSEGPVFTLYGARDRHTGREVSVRLIKAPFASEPEFLDRLRDVIRKAASVSHPNVERLYGLETSEGAPFLVGDASKGATLAERIRKLAPYSVPVSVSMMVSTLEGLAALHRAGLAHGDVSGQNIVVQPDGLARLQLGGVWEAYSASATAGAVVLPSMAPYLAPEVSSGAMPSPASDVYAVGILLFQLLTGRQPYMGETPVALAMKHATAPTPGVRSLNPSVPSALEEVVKKAMAKEPSERYANAAEMLSDLRFIEDAVRFGRPLTWPLKKPAGAQAAPSAKPSEAGYVAPKMSAVREERKELRRDREERDVPVWLMVTFATMLGVAACLLVLWMVFNLSAPRLVTVPEIRGLSQAEARGMLQSLGLEMRVGGEMPSERVPAGSVLDVYPEPKMKVREGGTVTVRVSSGSRFVAVPDLKGRTLDEAKSLLSSLDLELDDRVGQVRDFTVKRGLIVRQMPEPRKKVERFTRIRVAVSAGRATPSETAAAARPDERDRYVYTLRIRLSQIDQAVTMRVDMTDAQGTRTIYEKEHMPEDEVVVREPGYGREAVFRIFYDGELVSQVTQRANQEGEAVEEQPAPEGEDQP